MKLPKIVCDCGSVPDPAVDRAYDAPRDPLVGCPPSWLGRGHFLPSPIPLTPLATVVGCLQGQEGKMDTGHP